MTKKSDPTRSCVGCRNRRPTPELVRVRWHDGHLTCATRFAGEPTGGRGAWLCADALVTCASSAVTTRAFDRAFRRRVPAAAVDALMTTLETQAGFETDGPAEADGGGRLGNRR